MSAYFVLSIPIKRAGDDAGRKASVRSILKTFAGSGFATSSIKRSQVERFSAEV
jgi:hypothetical protein